MLLPAWPWLDALLNWLAYGVWDLSAWQLLLITLGMTHITIAAVVLREQRRLCQRVHQRCKSVNRDRAECT